MKHIFYLVAIFFIIYELLWIFSPVDYAKKSIERMKFLKEVKKKGFEDLTDEETGRLLLMLVVGFGFLFWMVTGLLTFNWVVFAAVLLFNIIIIRPISNFTKSRFNLYVVVHFLNSIKGLAFGVFIVLNSYHFKIDLWQLILNYFS